MIPSKDSKYHRGLTYALVSETSKLLGKPQVRGLPCDSGATRSWAKPGSLSSFFLDLQIIVDFAHAVHLLR